MDGTDALRQELLKLAVRLQRYEIRLIIGGGYGLLLRTEYIRRSGLRTRFDIVPAARATNDLDIFLTAEIISDAAKTALIRSALDELGYDPVPGAEFFQFVRSVEIAGFSQGLKIDLLAAPVPPELCPLVKMDATRIRPRSQTTSKLHAHTTREALTVNELLFPYELADDGSDSAATVYLPHPFSYLILKLFAARDRLTDETKGPYHAFDLYRTIAMMTEDEWQQALELRERHFDTEIYRNAQEIVRDLFANQEAAGLRLIRLHARQANEVMPAGQLEDFIEDMRELFAAT